FYPSTHCFPLFSFSCSDAHRALPSFPTRRSSDLDLDAGVHLHKIESAVRVEEKLDRSRAHVADRLGQLHGRVDRLRGRGNDRVRSEEHTSELQSRGHLVCRLLLEKKKNNKLQQIN